MTLGQPDCQETFAWGLQMSGTPGGVNSFPGTPGGSIGAEAWQLEYWTAWVLEATQAVWSLQFTTGFELTLLLERVTSNLVLL